ncbi:metal ABC transporter permease, partial [Streptococcus agalactiae]
IPDSALVTTVVGSVLILGVLAVFHRDLMMVGLDRGYAAAIGMRVMLLDIVLAVVVTLAVVMSVQTIGNILVIALLVTPAAAARMV